jgi:hypothetical protein
MIKAMSLFTESQTGLKIKLSYISSVDIEVMPTAKACCFPSAIIAYQKKQ